MIQGLIDKWSKQAYAGKNAKRDRQRKHTGERPKGDNDMPAVGNRNPLTLQYRDYGGEVKSIRLFGPEITALNIAGFLSDFGDLQAAMDAVTLGVRAAQTWGEQSTVSNDRAASKNAQVESEMLVRVQGATTEAPWSFRIPTVDYTAFNYADPPAGDSVILTGAGASAATTALIAAIEAFVTMPDDNGEGVTVVGIEVVR